ncbi:MAG: tRNA (guanosine(37)-N1)-methyltransferase TrmD [Candidatus Doudnabacteria bacterium]|nr:tRNA (guanosine(37)-N1)-methyltransferase TrmD [Candidatus Doudnabacteria bacterium]
MLNIKIITLFPNFIENFVEGFGIVKRAIKLKLLKISSVDLRKFGLGQRQVVDGRPYGGGVGMVLRADVIKKAIELAQKIKNQKPKIKIRTILLTPQGKPFKQIDAVRLAKYDHLVFVCGRYEGFDERVRSFVDEEISIGDYVLMGGELPALVISEAVMRLRPGVLGKDESSVGESFSEAMLEYPQYTKPEILEIKDLKLKNKKIKVPKVLLTGHHKNIEEWRREEALKRTKKRRPELLN